MPLLLFALWQMLQFLAIAAGLMSDRQFWLIDNSSIKLIGLFIKKRLPSYFTARMSLIMSLLLGSIYIF